MTAKLKGVSGRFRPASLADFKRYAKNVAWLVERPALEAQETLASIYGYADLHDLQQALKAPGQAGPFANDAPVNFAVATRREDQIELGAMRFDDAGADPTRTSLLSKIGLFARPKVHRALFEDVRSALIAGWPPEVVEKLAIYHPLTYIVDEDAVVSLGGRGGGMGRHNCTFLPSEMLKIMRRRREPQLYLLSHSPPPDHPDLPDFTDWPEHDEFLLDWREDGYEFAEFVATALLPKYAPGIELRDDEADAFYDAAARVYEGPSEANGNIHPLLAHIPEVTRLAHLWRDHTRYARAQRGDSGQPCIVLAESSFHARVPSLPGGLACIAQLVHTGSVGYEDMSDMQLWNYSATFLTKDSLTGRSIPVATMHGYYIVPWKDEYGVHPEDFFEYLDAESAMLNDVWKVLNFEFFPQMGYEDIGSFNQDRPFSSIATASITIAEQFRKLGLLPTLLNQFISLFEGYPFTQVDAGWDQLGVAEIDDASLSDHPEFQFSKPTVFVFPVEGVRQETEPLPPWHMVRRSSPQKLPITRRDAAVEQRKAKLTAHFLALNDQPELDADVIVYDPWEYPIT